MAGLVAGCGDRPAGALGQSTVRKHESSVVLKFAASKRWLPKMIRETLLFLFVGRILCHEAMITAASTETTEQSNNYLAAFTSTGALMTSDVTASSDEWRLLERVRVFSTMTTSYNWSARFDDGRDRDKTFTIVMSYRYVRGFFGSMSIQNGASYLTAAIEDYCRQDNNGLKDYYFE